jgi:hypothetical protein
MFNSLLIGSAAVAPGNGKPIITDGPNGDTYGYQKCEKLNFDTTLGDPTTVADCITIAAKGK